MSKVNNLRSEPFLWIHLAGISVFPAFLAITAIALSIGESYSFVVELGILALVGIVPVWLMQLGRTFDIFSVLFLSLKPECLSEERRLTLTLFKGFKQKFMATMTAIVMLLVLWLLYRLSPLTIGLVYFLPQWRILALSIAGVAFFASNLFLQIPLSVLLVLLTKETKLNRVSPYPLEKIEDNFTIPGIRVNKILWFLDLDETIAETS